jgi:phosphate-selective porin OprO/OprP
MTNMKLYAAFTTALMAGSMTSAFAQQGDGKVRSNGLGLVSADGENSINLTGRVHVDTRQFSSNFADGAKLDKDTAKYGDTFEIRRARIGLTGTLLKDISYELVFNAAASDSTNIDTGWINYGFNKHVNLRAGRFKQQFNLEELTSSNNIDFIERSFVNQFAPGKKAGMMLHGVITDGVSYGVTRFQESNTSASASGNFQSTARLAANMAQLANLDNTVLHLGFANHSGTIDVASGATGDVVKLRTDARGADGVFASTFASGDANNINEVRRKSNGFELAVAYGPVKFQMENVTAKFDFENANRSNIVDGTIKSQYSAIVYNITGEKWSDSYKDGSFGSIRPKSNYSSKSSGSGGWQIGYRSSSYDAEKWTATTLTSGAKIGKTETLGLTWLLNPNARVMLNHSTTKFNAKFAVGATSADKESVTTLRTQINF